MGTGFRQKGCGIGLDLTEGCGISHVRGVTWGTASLARRDRDKYSDRNGVAGLRQKIVAGSGIVKTFV